jgi:pilus assembly protein CpaE
MFRALVVATTPEAAGGLSRSLLGSGRFGPVRTADLSQSHDKLDQVLRINAPDVVFFEAGSFLDVEAPGQRLSELQPGLPIVAFGRAASWDYLLHLIRSGFCEYLPTPIHEQEVIEFAERLERQVRIRPVSQGSEAQLVSFLPAKPGAGASTVAINTSSVLAQQFHSRTLLVDLDFSAGIVSFALDLKPAFSILHALEHLNDLDDELWAKIVVEKGNLHVVPAPDMPAAEAADLSRLMEIMHVGRRFYDIVCVDLSGGLEEFTLGVMEESKHIFVVCSLETPVLHLARRRIARLSQLGFRDRLSVIVNRWNTGSGITLEQVSEMLGRPVFATVNNDYTELQKAFNQGVMVDPSSHLGRDFTSLAARIGGHSIPTERAPHGLWGCLTHWLSASKQEIHNVAARPDQPRLEPRSELRNSLANLQRSVAAKSDSLHENTQTDSLATAPSTPEDPVAKV